MGFIELFSSDFRLFYLGLFLVTVVVVNFNHKKDKVNSDLLEDLVSGGFLFFLILMGVGFCVVLVSSLLAMLPDFGFHYKRLVKLLPHIVVWVSFIIFWKELFFQKKE